MSREDLAAVAGILRERDDVMVLSDEIYSRILYDAEHVSIASEPGMQERTIILDGFSKTYAMTGWRLGYGVMPKDLAAQVAKLQTNSNSCTASFTQMAGVEALLGDQSGANAMVAKFRERRDVIVAGLNEIPGFKCHLPIGAFYVFPNTTGTGKSSSWLETEILQKTGVACLSGTAFGAFGEGYLRFSYANSVENIRKALERVKEFVSGL
jgi:aspartate/methionine/tyrosine aminotransferase